MDSTPLELCMWMSAFGVQEAQEASTRWMVAVTSAVSRKPFRPCKQAESLRYISKLPQVQLNKRSSLRQDYQWRYLPGCTAAHGVQATTPRLLVDGFLKLSTRCGLMQPRFDLSSQANIKRTSSPAPQTITAIPVPGVGRGAQRRSPEADTLGAAACVWPAALPGVTIESPTSSSPHSLPP